MTNFRSATRAAETTPLLFSSPQRMRAPQTAQGSWKTNFFLKLETPQNKRSRKFNALVIKFYNTPQAVPTENEVNNLVIECMAHGEVDVLRDILAEEPLQTLRIARPANECVWRILLQAMPVSCSVSQLILSNQKFDWTNTSLLFDLMGRMLNLKSLHLDSCEVTFLALQNPPRCPRLRELRDLRVTETHAPFKLVSELLNASTLSGFHLETNSGISDEEHYFLGMVLSESHASALHELTLINLRDEPCVTHYTDVMKNAAALKHVDLSRNELSTPTFQSLTKALRGKTELTRLSLAGCCSEMGDEFYWEQVAGIVNLESLVSLDLSRNRFPSLMKPVLMAIASHPCLRSLDLRDVLMSEALIIDVLPVILEKNTKLISLKLPVFKDSEFGCLVEAMEQNHSLQFLSVPNLEGLALRISAEELHRLHPNYLALMERVARNQRAWKLALTEGGMKVVLGSMRGINPGHVFQDVARYAAGHVVAEGSRNEAVALTLLNKKAHEEGLAALERLQKEQ